MSKKKKFPKRLLVFRTTDVVDDPILICSETPEDISEEFADEPVAVYELVTVGRLTVEKSLNAPAPKRRRSR